MPDVGKVENSLFGQIEFYGTKFNIDGTQNSNAKNEKKIS